MTSASSGAPAWLDLERAGGAKQLEYFTSLFRRAEAEDTNAQTILATLFEDGGPAFPRDLRAARRWYRRAAVTAEPDALTLWGAFLASSRSAKDKKEGLAILRKLVTTGHAYAPFVLARLFWNGDAAQRRSARRWLDVAIERGNLDALVYLGEQQVDRDPVAAFSLYLRAAESGASTGAESVANCYRRGLGVRVSARHADVWEKKATRLRAREPHMD